MNQSLGLKTKDPMLNYKKNTSQILPYDIASSLPVAEGMNTLKSRWMGPGAFRRCATDVTNIPNMPITRK